MTMYPDSVARRAMKIQEIILRAMSGKITWIKAALIIGVRDRSYPIERKGNRTEDHFTVSKAFLRCRPHQHPPVIHSLFFIWNCLILLKYSLHFKEQILLPNYTSDFSGNFHHQPTGVVFYQRIGRFHQACGPFNG